MMLAPFGHWEPFNLHPYLGYGVYRIYSFFNKEIPLSYAVGFTPLLIMSLSLLAFLWICARLKIHPFATFLAGLFFLLSPILYDHKHPEFDLASSEPLGIPPYIPASIYTYYNRYHQLKGREGATLSKLCYVSLRAWLHAQYFVQDFP